ncbi:MAG: hypothetical protein AB1449_13975 [Chloroflexota bacterium]
MADTALEHAGDGFDAAVGMGGEALYRALDGIVEGEMVKEQERVKTVLPPRAERAAQQDAGALDHQLRLDDLTHESGHWPMSLSSPTE